MFRQKFNTLYNPWREAAEVQRDMNRLFQRLYSKAPEATTAPGYPAMNVWTNENGVVVTAELPGVKPEDIDISVVGDTLTLSGSREPEQLPEDTKYHRQERKFGQFSRSFQFPFEVQVDNVEAMFQKGVLHLSLPRAEAEKPKKITVKAVN